MSNNEAKAAEGDLSDFVGDTPLRASLTKKLDKVLERLEKWRREKIIPLEAEADMYKKMIAAIDERTNKIGAAIPSTDLNAEFAE